MNTKPIESARDSDLRLSLTALTRAAQRARQLARQTGTRLVVVRKGVVEHVAPDARPGALAVREPDTDYGDVK